MQEEKKLILNELVARAFPTLRPSWLGGFRSLSRSSLRASLRSTHPDRRPFGKVVKLDGD